MPCPWTRRCSAAESNTNADALPSPTSAQAVEDWKKIRRYNLRMMRKQVRVIVLLMALMEAIRVGPVQIVYAGRHGYPAPAEDDYGIAYAVGYFISWLYVCVFMVIWVPVFSWWVPNTPVDEENPSLAMKTVSLLKRLNMILLPFTVGISLIGHLYFTIHSFIYVDSRTAGSSKFPKNTRKNWAVRFFMLLGIALSTSFGYGAFQILAQLDLAHVKKIEYAVIVVPFQINFGVFLGTLMQFRMEKRLAGREAQDIQNAKAEDARVDEKAALIQV